MITIDYHGRKIRLDDVMLGALQWALKNAGKWQDIGREQERIDAIRRLEAAGLVEIFEVANRYRVHDKALATKPASSGRVARGGRRPGGGRGK